MKDLGSIAERILRQARAREEEDGLASPNGPRPWMKPSDFVCSQCENRGVYESPERPGWWRQCRRPDCLKERRNRKKEREADEVKGAERDEII